MFYKCRYNNVVPLNIETGKFEQRNNSKKEKGFNQ